MFIINSLKSEPKSFPQLTSLPRNLPKKMLTGALSRYKVNLAIPKRAGCACANLRAPQLIPASNLSEGSEVGASVRLSRRNRESRAHTFPSWKERLLVDDGRVSQSATLWQDFELQPHQLRLKIGCILFFRNPRLGFGFPAAPAAPRSTVRAGEFTKENWHMRSDLVFGALSHVSNRYQLCQLASKATRMLHKPNTRLQDTTNEVLGRFHTTNPGSIVTQVSQVSQPVERRRAA
jgi:hypothetical protein